MGEPIGIRSFAHTPYTIMIILSYLLLAVSSYIFSQWSWNRCLAFAGKATVEKTSMDFMFGVAVPATIFALHTILR